MPPIPSQHPSLPPQHLLRDLSQLPQTICLRVERWLGGTVGFVPISNHDHEVILPDGVSVKLIWRGIEYDAMYCEDPSAWDEILRRGLIVYRLRRFVPLLEVTGDNLLTLNRPPVAFGD